MNESSEAYLIEDVKDIWNHLSIGLYLLYHIHKRIKKWDCGVCLWSNWDRFVNGIYFASTEATILYFFISQYKTKLGTIQWEVSLPNVKCQKTHKSIKYIDEKKRWKNWRRLVGRIFVVWINKWQQLRWQFAMMGICNDLAWSL